MLKRHWIAATTAGLALIVAFAVGGYILGFGLGEQAGERDAKTDSYAQHAQYEINSTCAGLDGIAQTECIVRVIEATNEHKRAQDDLNAQRNMAKWALLMLLVTVAMAIITAIGVYYVWRTLTATQDMARDTRYIGQAQARAYVSVISGRLSFDPITYMFVCELTVQNTGNSPASQIRTSGLLQLRAEQSNGTPFNMGSFSDVMGHTDLPTGKTTRVVEFNRPPISTELANQVRGAYYAIEISGQDVFGHSFIGILKFIADHKTLASGAPSMILGAESFHPTYDENPRETKPRIRRTDGDENPDPPPTT